MAWLSRGCETPARGRRRITLVPKDSHTVVWSGRGSLDTLSGDRDPDGVYAWRRYGGTMQIPATEKKSRHWRSEARPAEPESYDDRQVGAVRVTCAACGRSVDATVPRDPYVCGACR